MADDFNFDGDIGQTDNWDTPSPGALTYAVPDTSAFSPSASIGQTDSGSSGGLGSILAGALSSGVFGGSPSLGDGYGGATGSAGADGLAALTNGGGASGTDTSPNSGYTLNDKAGITHAGETSSSSSGSPLKQLASLVQDDKGNLDLSKLIKVGTGLGGVFEAYQRNKQAAAAKAAQLGQAATTQAAQTWTPAQAAMAGHYFGSAQNRTPLLPSAGGIKSIVPASVTRPQVGYASGGGIGAVDDGRYGAPSSDAATVMPASDAIYSHILRNLVTGNLAAKEKAAGSGGSDPVTLQQGTHRIIPDSGHGLVPISDLIRSIPLLLKGQIGASADPEDDGTASMADGGGVVASNEDMGGGALGATSGSMSHGTYGLISGAGDGQSDSIPINAAAGEYMVDAESVSMLGNGDNNAGAEALDAWREALRQHKRSAPPDQIAPATGADQLPPIGAQ